MTESGVMLRTICLVLMLIVLAFAYGYHFGNDNVTICHSRAVK